MQSHFFFSFLTQRLVLSRAAAAAASAASAASPSMAPSSSAGAAATAGFPAIPGVPVAAVFMAYGKLSGQPQRRGDRLRHRRCALKAGFAGGGAGDGTTLSSLGLFVAGSPASPSPDRSNSAARSLAATLYAGEVR